MSKPPQPRLLYLDWVRGLAALVMLQGHVFQSFLRNDLREGGPYQLSQFAGGMPPAVFLFLLGVTFAFLMDSQERKGVSPGGRCLAALKRAGYLFGAAFAFRLQLWLLSFDKSPWTDLLRVDILNCMGLSLAVLSVMAAFQTRERVRLCAVLGVAIAAAAPLVSALDWQRVPALLHDYLAPDHASFGFFPWAAFVAFGMSFGSILRQLDPDDIPAAMQWFAWGGLALAFGAWSISNMSISLYSNSDFWLNSPGLVFVKCGVVLMVVAFAWIWNLGPAASQWSPVRQFGVTSLVVYWVHIELIYGRWFGWFKERLTVGQTVIAVVLTMLAMLGVSLARTHWSTIRSFVTSGQPALPERASGD